MIILNLKTKSCMQHLLLKSTFDSFSLIEGDITTYNTFKIDGYIHKSFFEEAPEKDYSSWGDVREFCFNIIRGKRTPLNFKFILSLPQNKFVDFLTGHEIAGISPADIQGLYLNIKYDGTSLQCTTGTSLTLFTLDKTLENAWDHYIQQFFLTHELVNLIS